MAEPEKDVSPDETTQPADRESPKVHSAAETVARAEAELKKARKFYESICSEAAEKVKQARETTLGDLAEGTLAAVKRHPGPGVLIAMAVGFFLGRLFRR